jgi:TonB family protein
MNEIQPPTTRTPEPQIPDARTPETQSLARQKSRQDKIFGYSTVASLVVTFGWLAWVSNSDLFGSAANLADLKPQLIKIVKPPIPQKPKPKKKEKPPPPPPKQKPPPKLRPLKPPPPHPRPQTPRPAPLHRVAVATTHNTRAVSTITVPETAPNTDTKPTASGDSPLPTPPAPQQVPTPTPAPSPVREVVKPPPPPPPPPVREVVKPPPPPPPPPPRPRNYSPINSQEAGPVSDYAQVDMPSGVSTDDIPNKTVTIAFEIDEGGHATNVHVRGKSSGNADVDDACKEAIRRTRFKPAIQDHLKLRAPGEYTFSVG